jgi:hypothetical protein
MSWKLEGNWYESCSCKSLCRCTVGPAEPDQGWCSGAQLAVLDSGNVDGLDVAGCRYLVLLELPGDFTNGVIDRARMHFDPASTSSEQRDAIESIYQGRRGGVWEGIGGMIGEWLPTNVTEINITADGDTVKSSVAGVGGATLTTMKTEAGKQTVLLNAPVMAGFEVDTLNLAVATDAKWADPDMRAWESLGFGASVPFSWSGS